MQDYIDIHVEQRMYRTINLPQPHLIDQILTDVLLLSKDKRRHLLAVSSRILQRYEYAPSFTGHFNYRSIFGKLNFLEKGGRPESHTLSTN